MPYEVGHTIYVHPIPARIYLKINFSEGPMDYTVLVVDDEF